MKRLVIGVLVGLLAVAGTAGASVPLDKLAIHPPAPRGVSLRVAAFLTSDYASWNVADGWATSFSDPRCKRVSRSRVRCRYREFGGGPVWSESAQDWVKPVWVVDIYRHRGCIGLFVHRFERFPCYA